MSMRIDLNIIKLCMIFSLSGVYAEAVWLDLCQAAGCQGCSNIKSDIENAADKIDKQYYKELENNVSKAYQKKILDANLAVIDKIQEGITKNVAHIRAMEHQANIDTKELNFLLQKSKELYTLPMGSK